MFSNNGKLHRLEPPHCIGASDKLKTKNERKGKENVLLNKLTGIALEISLANMECVCMFCLDFSPLLAPPHAY